MKRLALWLLKDVSERVAYLLSLCGLMFSLSILADGVQTGDARYIFWGVVALALVCVVFWGITGDA